MLAPPVGGGIAAYSPLAWLVAGTTIGGLVTGAVLLLLWQALAPFDAARLAIVLGVGGLAAAAVVWPALRPWLPEAACQLREEVMAAGTVHRAAFRWGVELGMGVCTFAVTPALYAVLALALAQSEALLVIAILAIYGWARGGAIVWFAVVHARQPLGARPPGLGLERHMRLPLTIAIAAAVATVLS